MDRYPFFIYLSLSSLYFHSPLLLSYSIYQCVYNLWIELKYILCQFIMHPKCKTTYFPLEHVSWDRFLLNFFDFPKEKNREMNRTVFKTKGTFPLIFQVFQKSDKRFLPFQTNAQIPCTCVFGFYQYGKFCK